MNRILKGVGIGSMLALMSMMLVGTASAAGQNQYGSGFPIGACGYIHGAFGNINGNFSWVAAYAKQGGIGSATGPANSGASAECVAEMGH